MKNKPKPTKTVINIIMREKAAFDRLLREFGVLYANAHDENGEILPNRDGEYVAQLVIQGGARITAAAMPF